MLAICDGDIIAYRCAAVTEGLDENLARWQTDELIQRLLAEVGTLDHLIYLSGDDNFRYTIYPEYKANRPKERPAHLQAIRKHILTNWESEITHGYEADDALGIHATRAPDEVVICSIDKDLLQIPGIHYNFVKREFTEVTEYDGQLSFYLSLLVGDATDNIKGCPKIGKVRAGRCLDGTEGSLDSYSRCLAEYIHAYQGYDKGLEAIKLNGRLLWILRTPDEFWQPPELGVEVL